MIPRERRWLLLLLLHLIHIASSLELQTPDGRTYDNNDWIPITPATVPQQTDNPQVGEQKKATGRVLNLDAPVQKFFSEDEYEYRQKHPVAQQYLQEASFPKGPPTGRRHKISPSPEYKFEVPPPPSPHEQPPPLSPAKQPAKQPPIRQPAISQERPIEHPEVSVSQQAPAPDAQSIYEQYNIPFNASFYESLNPGSINQEILGAIKNNQNLEQSAITPAPTTVEKESVQLLYVPLESLQPNQPMPQDSRTVYRQLNAPVSDRQVYNANPDVSKQQRLANIQQDFVFQALQAHRLQEQFQQEQPILIPTTTTTTPRPSKRKPHQPPLAIFMASKGDALVSDVLDTLRGAKSIPVQDNIHPNSPQIFIGPSTLKTSERYTKFLLPYLNSMDGNRIERKIDELPFFVAPLSYKAPDGYSKIPLPSPHVGSVIISTKSESENKIAPQRVLIQPNQINDYRVVQQPIRQNSYLESITPKSADQYRNQYFPDTISQNEFVPINPPRYHIPQRAPSQLKKEPAKQEYDPEIATTIPTIKPQVLQYKPETIYEQRIPQQELFTSPGYPRPAVQKPYRRPQEPIEPVTLLSEERLVKPSINITPKTIPKSQLQELLEESKLITPTSQTLTSRKHPDINPLELAINEFELHQINSQLVEPNKRKVVKEDAYSIDDGSYNNLNGRYVSSTQEPIVEQVSTTSRPERSKPRRRKPTRRPTVETTTTERSFEKGKYTVLEEFSIKSPATANSAEQSYTEPHRRVPQREQVSRPASTTSSAEQSYTEPQRRPIPQREQVSRPAHATTSAEQSYSEQQRRPLQQREQVNRSAYTTTSAEQSYSEPQRRPLPQREQVSRPAPTTTSTSTTTTSTTTTTTPSPIYESDILSSIFNTPTFYGPTSQDPDTTYRDASSQTFHDIKTLVEKIPAKVYTLDTGKDEIEPIYSRTRGKSQTRQQQTITRNESVEQLPQAEYETKQIGTDSSRIRQDIISERGKIEHETEATQTATPQKVRQDYTVPYKPTYSGADFTVTPSSYQKDEVAQYDSNFRARPDLTYQSGERQSISTEEPYNQYSIPPEQPTEHDIYLSNLQDQAVRSLLVPKLLAPTSTEQQLPSTPAYESRPTSEELQEIVSTTKIREPLTTTTEIPTTRTSRTRGRQRGTGSRFTVSSSTTSTPRRRRPVSRTPVERTTQQPDYVLREENEATRRSSTAHQRTRTRGRAQRPQVVEQRISTTENGIKYFKEPEVQSRYESTIPRTEPQSFMQFEHTIEDQKIITVKPDVIEQTSAKEYHQVYNLPEQASEERPRIQYDNTATSRTPVVDIQITHPIDITSKDQEVNVITKPRDNREYVKYSSNIHSEDGLISSKNEEPVKQPSRVRGRTRGRSRFPSPTITTTTTTTTTTTRRPITNAKTTTEPPREEEEEEEEEFYGFIREPKFAPVAKLQAESQNKKTVINLNGDYQTEKAPVKFVGEIRPKYYSSTVQETPSTTTQRLEVETPRPRIRARTRGPSRATTHRQAESETRRNPEQVTRRSGSTVRTRGRGSAHYRVPENLRTKATDDEDVEGGNYPVAYLQKRQSSTTPAPTFQIMIDSEDDQASYSSINTPQVVPGPENWTSVSAPANQIIDNGKTEKTPTLIVSESLSNDNVDPSVASSIQGATSEIIRAMTEPVDIDIQKEIGNDDTEAIIESQQEEASTAKHGRRRGAWKLIKQKPLDPLETAESQNYHSVINEFDSIVKVKPSEKEVNQQTMHYQTFAYFNPTLEQNSETYDYESKKIETTTTTAVDQSNEKLEEDTNDESTPQVTENIAEEITTLPPIFNEQNSTKPKESLLDSLFEMFGAMPGFKENENRNSLTTQSPHSEIPTTLLSLPEEVTEPPVTTSILSQKTNSMETETEQDVIQTTTAETNQAVSETSPSSEVVKNTPKGVEPWEMRAVKTSTSTEVSHETEICYKGKCVRSQERRGL